MLGKILFLFILSAAALSITKPTVAPTTSRADKCNSIRGEVQINCGWNNLTTEDCEALGCCYDGSRPFYIHPCFYIDRDECNVVNVAERKLCFPFEVRKEYCESEDNCCFDDTDYGFPTVKCFGAQQVCSIDEKAKRPCGNASDERSCTTLGCCFDGKCYYPSDYNYTDDQCLVNQDQRIDCGFEGMTHIQCKWVKGCCYQDNVPSGVPHCFYSKTQMDSECLVDQDQRIDCGFEGMTPSQCKEKQCCYEDNVRSGVPHCFYNKTRKDSECLVDHDQRIDCGFEGMTQIQCKEKPCCYEDDVPSGVPHCFYSKTQMAALPTTKPTVAPTTSRADKCNSIRSKVQINCGWNDLTREDCEALGCCYDGSRPWYIHPCFYIDRDECNVVKITERKPCVDFEVGKETCDLLDYCCFDDTDYGFPTVKCFAAQQVCYIDEKARRPCGNASDERSCTTLGCCFDISSAKCYYPSDNYTAALPTPEPSDSECLVDQDQRIDCGFYAMTQIQCKEKQCCYQDNVPIGVPHCFYNKTQMAAFPTTKPTAASTTSSAALPATKPTAASTTSSAALPATKPTAAPTTSSDSECLVDQDQRTDCGFEGMTQIQCKEKQCCYQDNVPSGVPHCFYNKTQMADLCRKVCPSGGMRKRHAPDYVTDRYSLVQGPIHLARDKRDGNGMELSDKNGSSVAVMMVLALACAVCLAGTVLILARKSRDTSARYIRLTGAESPITQ